MIIDENDDFCSIFPQVRGPVHRSCNLKYRESRKIPVIFHNLKNYDSHLLMQHLGSTRRQITCIANTTEKYMAFRIGNLQFLDSYQFMPDSLDKLVNNLVLDGKEKFSLTSSYFCNNQEKLDLVLRKNPFPYDYLDSMERLDECLLPDQQHFYNRLTETECSDEEYKHARRVWQQFEMQKFSDYLHLYLMCDVLLLADVCQNFREMCRDEAYNIEPLHKFTSPGVAFEASLKMTAVELELLTDEGMHLLFERGIRGGLCNASHRYACANNPLIPENYNEALLQTFIMLLDANNLYGHGMIQALPESGFRWMTKTEICNTDFTKVDADAKLGFVLEVDLDYPTELHDSHAEFPMAPELAAVTSDCLPVHLKHMAQEPTNIKLLTTLWNKHHYVVHYRLLQFYMRHGLKLRKIRRVIQFKQSKWLKKYINFNTEMRTKAITEFAKSFFKLMVSMHLYVPVFHYSNLSKCKNVYLKFAFPCRIMLFMERC